MIVLPGPADAILLAMLDNLIVSTALRGSSATRRGRRTCPGWSHGLISPRRSHAVLRQARGLYGRKTFFVAAIPDLPLAGSALSGLSQSMDELIAFRRHSGPGRGRP